MESILLLRNAPRAAFTCGPPDYLQAEFRRLQALETATAERTHKVLAAAPPPASNLAVYFAASPQLKTVSKRPTHVVSQTNTAEGRSPPPPAKRCRGKQREPTHDVAAPHRALRGLQNKDNTCYMNALLVSLHASCHVQTWVRDHMTTCGHGNCPVPFLCQDFRNLNATLQPSFLPELASRRATWCRAFAGRRHQDVTEALSKLLEAAETCELRSRQDPADDLDHQLTLPVWRCFGSVKFQTLFCATCRASSSTRHLHSFVHVEPNLPLFHDCVRSEQLTNDSCPQCAGQNCRRMNLAMRTWPRTLVFCVNRWSTNPDATTPPFSQHIVTPEPESSYQVKAAIYHEGSREHGHYTAAKPSDGALVVHNDDHPAKLVPITHLQQRNLYAVLYDAAN
eukprot:Skav232864  [mRNA]  locus=scaffold2451:198264:199448:+ [translate_table: standard]